MIKMLLSSVVLPLASQAAPPVVPKPSVGSSVVQEVVLGGKEACGLAPVKAGSIEDVVRKHTVRLYYEGKPFCSGTPIRSNIILTAAHCAPPGTDDKDYVVEVFINEKEGYRKIPVDKIERSLSQSRPDIAALRLSADVPKANVIPAGAKCDDKEMTQAGWGLTDNAEPAKCVRFTSYTRGKPRILFGLSVSGGEKNLFYGIPREDVMPRVNMGCNGDSGGPIFCKSRGKWAYSGLLSAVTPKEAVEGKEDDPAIKAWVTEAKKCEDLENPARHQDCVRLCRLSHGITGYELSEAKLTIDGILELLRESNREPQGKKSTDKTKK